LKTDFLPRGVLKPPPGEKRRWRRKSYGRTTLHLEDFAKQKKGSPTKKLTRDAKNKNEKERVWERTMP